jgi:cation diffusion facilitator family transporter
MKFPKKISERYAAISRVTFINASGNLILAIIKLFIGWIGHSQALIADGIHSLSDLIGDALVYLTAYVGNQEPDNEHPYGHKRVETLGAIIVAFILILLGAYWVVNPIWQLLHPIATHKVSLSVLITACISVLINESLFRFAAFYGKKWHSKLLVSNAWHNRSDALVSIVVVVTTILSLFHLNHFDLIGSLIIGCIILYSGVKITFECFMELIDTGVDEDTMHDIKKIILDVPGILRVHELRSRTHSGAIFLDLHIQVPPQLTVSEGHQIAELVHNRLIHSPHPITDVTVHIDPEDDEYEHLNLKLPTREKVIEDIEKSCQELKSYADLTKILLHFYHGSITIDLFFSSEPALNERKTFTNHLSALPYCNTVRFFVQLS